MPALVLPFTALSLGDLPRVGGKGANLGELSAAGFPVPPGFCVTTSAYDAFIAAAPEGAFAPLEGLSSDLGQVRAAGTRVREALASVPVPPEVEAVARQAWSELGEDWPWAVRSSATAEDLPDASFAGQQDTYLNLRGADAIVDGIKRCWISLFTDRAILYRIEHGFSHAEVQLAVVVQRQVLPQVSGILFTADPITSNRQVASIDAGFGLGEALVSGKVSADLFRLDKRSGELLSRRIADKALVILPLPEGGTEEVALEGEARTRPSLTDGQARDLLALGMRIEAHYGVPQDVEWCIEGDELFVVQSRPITTLYPRPSPAPSEASTARGLHVYVSWNHVQSMTDAMPELARSLIQLANPLGKAGEARVHTPYMASAAGRLYHDPTELLRIGGLGRRAAAMLMNSDPLMGLSLGDVVRRPAFSAGGRPGEALAMGWALALRSLPVTAGTLRHLAVGAPEPKVPAAAERLEQRLADWKSEVAGAEPGEARVRVVRAMVWAILPDIAHTFPLIFASIAANVSLRRWTETPELVDQMLRATPHNPLTEKDEALAAIAEHLRGDAVGEGLCREPPDGDAAALLARLDHLPAAREALSDWFARFGDRGPGEVDVSRPRYRDDPRGILRALATTLDGPAHAFAEQQAAFAKGAGEAADALVSSAARGLLGPLRAPLVRWLTRVGRSLFAAREQPKFYWLRVLGVARSVLWEEGQRLASQGILAEPDDVWHLDIDELVALSGGQTSLAEVVPSRREDHARHAALEPARVLTSDGEVVVARHDASGAPAGALLGVSASAGVAEGVVRVISDPATETLRKGEVLVAAYTDPGWTPLFPQAAALVMEVGGQMTHGSVVAREYGIPAVVCVPGATRTLRTGQRVRVDGDQGWVVPLDGEEGSGTNRETTTAVESMATAAPAAQPENPTES